MENEEAGARNRYTGGRAGRKGRYYRHNLIIVLIVSSIPGLIIGLLVYFMAGGVLRRSLLRMHNRQIEQRADNINDQLSNLELMLAHWAFDPKFDYGLSNMDFTRNHERAWDITKTLVVMQGSNSMVRQVELYLAGNQPVRFGTEYGTLSAEEEVLYGKLLKQERSTYWTEWAFDPVNPEQKEPDAGAPYPRRQPGALRGAAAADGYREGIRDAADHDPVQHGGGVHGAEIRRTVHLGGRDGCAHAAGYGAADGDYSQRQPG